MTTTSEPREAGSAPAFERIRYTTEDDGTIGRITLARPERRNAQDYQMLHEIDRAFALAAQDDRVRVVILDADGPHFSSGHDVSGGPLEVHNFCVSHVGGFDQPGVLGHMSAEEEYYLGMCWRWRNFPKPTIAQVHGKVIAGGLMLVWPMDLIIASDDATFSDPTVAFGVNGHEYFVHAWEFGPRKAKEMLFRSAALTAAECRDLGMVNHVVARDDLPGFTLGIAREIAGRPVMGTKLAKSAVNQSLDAQGQWTALQAAFGLHHVGHAHARVLHGIPVDPSGLDVIRRLSR
ncbi:enoyl-CoA hydratase [Amycolatopsis pigmentata]|uniref:Enoyl-CoA hydratase n=1 Tax=Amycolatopsis pigmentata TaxID=450801 RepID=A0ABW5G910_9PSEU